MPGPLDQVSDLLKNLAQVPAKMATSAEEHKTALRVGESSRGLFTMHRAGRRIAAVTIPARGKTAWISVLNPKQGTSRGGDRTRFVSREEALEHSRAHTLEVAGKIADRIEQKELARALAELDTLLGAL